MTGIIIQARMQSKRLPFKVMLDVGGKPMVVQVIERAQRAGFPCVLAVPGDERSLWKGFMRYHRDLDNPIFFGEHQDVLARYYFCAKEHGFDRIVRITADCPCVDPGLIEATIKVLAKYGAHYAATRVMKPEFPDGQDVEVFTIEALARAHREATTYEQREHVTPYMKADQHNRIAYLTCQPCLLSQSKFSIDTESDYLHVRWNWAELTDTAWVDYILEDGYADNL